MVHDTEQPHTATRCSAARRDAAQRNIEVQGQIAMLHAKKQLIF